MALAVVGSAFLSSFLNVLFDRMTSRDFIDFFKTREIDMEMLKSLKSLLYTVSGVLDDAEDRQFTYENIKKWLDELKDATYDADDLLNEFDYEVTRFKVESQQQANHAPTAVNFTKNQQKRMEEIVKRLKNLVDDSVALRLKESVKRYTSFKPTTPVVRESGIVGRDEDKEAILKLLQANDDEDESGIGVIPIVGMGGIGKTTLAKLVYNDNRAKELFQIRAWVCVSENYDGLKIKRDILKRISKSGAYDDLTPEDIDEGLMENLKDKRYLLVLDDLWNDDCDDWEILLTPLMEGASGSKIIVTTRNRSVASRVCILPSSYELHELDGEYSWQLFVKHAFPSGKVNESLADIGKKIVRKCQGLPLAVKMLGDLLRNKREKREWKRILENDKWDSENDKVLPALRLSYHHLSSQLKQCFSYLAIFPKDYEMTKEEIIHLWMAQGFLLGKGGEMMEELGEKLIDELVSRSFLNKLDDEPTFLMHDLIHDLAQHNCGKFLVRMERDNSCEVSGGNRHFSYYATKIDIFKIVEAICETQGLRTFLILPWVYVREEMPELLHNKISQLGCLRILSLHGFTTIAKLPDLLDKLKQLRYLNLAETSVEKLPESVCTLYHLQILILYRCKELVALPKNMRNLINLYCLDIRVTPKLQETPQGMGNLKELRTLHKFFVGKQNGANIDDLGKLRLLQRELSIFNLQNVTETSTDILENKENLEDLELEWNGETGDSKHERTVLEGLEPCTSIKKLSICGYGGTKFPDWVGHSCYMNIISLKLKGCKYLTSLPPLGQLSSLENLSIREFDAVVEVGVEFCKMPFNSLKTLQIEDMKQWEDWVICEAKDSVNCKSFPKLEKLTICSCPKLKAISTCEPTHKIFKSLNKLHVKYCPNLKTSNLLDVSSFKELEMKGNGVCLKQLPSQMYRLDTGSIYRGPKESKPRMEGNEEMLIVFNALDFEEIKICGNKLLQSIPFEVLPNLRHLTVFGCNKLETLSASEDPLHLPLLASLEINYCDSLVSFPKGGIIAPNLTSLTVFRCDKLETLSASEDPLHLPLLASLEIRECNSLISFAKGGITAPNLTRLVLEECSNLKSLPQHMHNNFQSLEHLEIQFCGKVDSFPEGGLPANLRSLEIYGCDDKIIGGRLQWGLQKLNALSHLRLGSYKGDDLNYFPEQTLLPSFLNSLHIITFEHLKFINYQGLRHLTSLSVLKIEYCAEIESFPEEGLPSNLQTLEIIGCHKLIGGRLDWGLERFHALSKLRLSYYKGDDLDCFPEQTLLPPTLRYLEISSFRNLKSINYGGLHHLTSLAELEISFCNNLQSLPEGGLPSSLSVLKIKYCPLLEKRCARDKGEDWPKISHISTIQIYS